MSRWSKVLLASIVSLSHFYNHEINLPVNRFPMLIGYHSRRTVIGELSKPRSLKSRKWFVPVWFVRMANGQVNPKLHKDLLLACGWGKEIDVVLLLQQGASVKVQDQVGFSSVLFHGLVFTVLCTSRTLSHKSSFIPRTCNIWNVLPSCFPESYILPSFKFKINKLDLISLSS